MIRSAQGGKVVVWGERARTLASWSLGLVAVLVGALLVAAAPASAESFSNTTAIKIPASGDEGAASPYPSPISVSGMSGPITDVNVTLNRVGHTEPWNIGVLLVSPSGDSVMLMRFNCGAPPIEDDYFTFDQQNANPMPQGFGQDVSCPDVVYRPNPDPRVFTDGRFSFPAPAPPGPHGVSLSDFNNETPNGTWKLYVVDFFDGDVGDIEVGWTLTLTTRPVDVAIPGSGTFGFANPYPVTRTISGYSGSVISDLNVGIDGIWHQRPDDIDMLLVGPQGQKVMLMSDACGSFEVAAYGWTWDDEAAAPMPDGDTTNRCGSPSHRPTDYEPGQNLPAPAPAGPYSTSLSSFDGTNPNGEWKLFIFDDALGATGFFTNRFVLHITTVPGTTDTTAPKVTSVIPREDATGIGAAAYVSAVFSEPMRARTINTNTVKLFRAGTTTALSATITYDASTKKAVLNPSANLQLGSRYKAVVSSGAKDLAGNTLDQNQNPSDGNQPKVWFFRVRN